MNSKSLPLILVSFLLLGCLGQSKPSPTPSPTPINNPPIADFSYSWTGGDEEQPWTCSKVTFKAEVSDPDGDDIFLLEWYDNNNQLYQFIGKSSFETKLWPDGIHTIKLKATDVGGAKTVVEKQINVKYEVPVPVKTKNGVSIATIYVPSGLELQARPENSWAMSEDSPLLGQYDMANPVTIDWHIKWALEHGINTFWQWITPHGNPPEQVIKHSLMTYYRDGFLKAKYKDKIKFCAIIDGLAYNPFGSEYDPADSPEKDIEILSKYHFNQPNYNKIDGKPVVFFYGIDLYLCDNCENKKERENLLESQIELIRETAKKNGYDLFLIGDRQKAFHDNNDEVLLENNFDAITAYGMEGARNPDKYDWITDERGRQILIAPYGDMVDAAIKREKELSELAKNKGKVYIPFVEQGFNNEKRFNAGYRGWIGMVKRTNPTPQKFEEFVNGVKLLIDPKTNTLLTTWNELMEGNVIEPTKEFGFSYLDIIRDNFAIKPAGGWPPDIVPTKNCGCTEYKGWSSEIGIPSIVFASFRTENLLPKVLKVRKEENY